MEAIPQSGLLKALKRISFYSSLWHKLKYLYIKRNPRMKCVCMLGRLVNLEVEMN